MTNYRPCATCGELTDRRLTPGGDAMRETNGPIPVCDEHVERHL